VSSSHPSAHGWKRRERDKVRGKIVNSVGLEKQNIKENHKIRKSENPQIEEVHMRRAIF
jgi:hypothetical protein